MKIVGHLLLRWTNLCTGVRICKLWRSGIL